MSATTDAPAAPGARAVARYVRTSASKARRVVNLVRGLPAKQALTVLQFAPQAASVPVYKVVASAIANAENNEQLDPDSLLISEAYVNEGPTMRRYRPRAQMRPGPIRKRTCHITIAVEAVQPDAPTPPARTTPGRARKRPAAVTPAAQPASTDAEPAEATAEAAAEAPAEKASKATKTTKTTKTTKKAAKKAAPEAEADAPAKKAAAKPAAKETAAKKSTKKAAKKAAAEEETE